MRRVTKVVTKVLTKAGVEWSPIHVDNDGRVLAFRVYADSVPAWQLVQVAQDAAEYRVTRVTRG